MKLKCNPVFNDLELFQYSNSKNYNENSDI